MRTTIKRVTELAMLSRMTGPPLRTLSSALPHVTYRAGETVIADGSRTGQGGGAWRCFR